MSKATSQDIREGVAEGFVRVALNHPWRRDNTERHRVRVQAVAHREQDRSPGGYCVLTVLEVREIRGDMCPLS